MTEIAYAKLNLALHVRRRRADGYHDIETIFAFCADGDEISTADADALTLTIDGPFADALSADDNLVLRAAHVLDRQCGPGRGASIRLTKNLPVASGIGGGSADAAATLRALAQLWQSDVDLLPIAQALGADVPACLLSQTAIGTGRGDQLARVDSALAGTPVLLVNPNVAVSTATVFALWDGEDRGALHDWRDGRNDLEAPARTLLPQIAKLIDWLATQPGAITARMSGSGATCFAMFTSTSERDAAAAAVATGLPGCWSLCTVLR